jgi:DNA-binding NarL/FixJ family response regulator
MLTSYDDDEARGAALLAGASGFVLKQIRSRRLLDAVYAAALGEEVVDDEGHGSPAADTTPMERLALESLTPRERRVLDLVVEGLTNAEIGRRLGIREKTVRNHVTNVLAKLGFTRRTQAAVYMVRHQGPPRS